MEVPKPSSRTRPNLNRQVRAVHFEDFSGKEFERLALAFILRADWPDAQWLGQSGGDRGRDIWCPSSGTVFICANYRGLTIAKVRSDLQKLAKFKKPSRAIVIVCGGSVSSSLREKAQAEADKLGLPHPILWSGSEFEEKVRITAPHLFARFCHGEPFPDSPEALRGPDLDAPTSELVSRRISPEASDLLVAMAGAHDGYLLRTESHDGYALSVAGTAFLQSTSEARTKAKWQRRIHELLSAGLIVEDGSHGDLFAVTDEGFMLADHLRSAPGAKDPETKFTPTAMGDVAQFFRAAGELISEEPFGDGEGPVAATLPSRPTAFLRVYPKRLVEPIRSGLAAKQLLAQGQLAPMGLELSGWSWSRNTLGAICYAGPFEDKLTNFSQLFLSREICGLDLRLVRRLQQDAAANKNVRNVLLIYAAELTWCVALRNFVHFHRQTLKESGALVVEAGIQGIKGCELGAGIRTIGRALTPDQRWTGLSTNPPLQPEIILRPFFEQLWESFGVARFDEAQTHLVTSLAAHPA